MAKKLLETDWKAHFAWGHPTPQIYVIQEGDEAICKIGFSRNAEWRRSSLNGGNHRPLRIRHVWICASRAEAIALEAGVLKHFERQRIGGEWLAAHPDDIAKHVDFMVSNGAP